MTLSPLLMLHIAAGSLGILSGGAALGVRKGARLHRIFGTVFFVSMLTMSALGAWLALTLPPGAQPGAPPSGSVSVGVLTFYLVATAWMAARHREERAGPFEYGALIVALGLTCAMVLFGLKGALDPAARPGAYAPFFVFAGFAAFAAALDLKAIWRGLTGPQRIARHLWRMCVALFFAAAFFFIGQQKVMPAYMHRAPLLFVPVVLPLLLMAFWLVRVRLTGWWKRRAVT